LPLLFNFYVTIVVNEDKHTITLLWPTLFNIGEQHVDIHVTA